MPPVPRVATFVAAVFVVVAAAGCGGDDDAADAADRRSAQVRAAAVDAGLPNGVADLLGVAAGVLGERFRVTYDLGGESGGTAVLTQDPPQRRVDLRATIGSGEVTRSMFTDGESSTVCERAAGKWTCRAAAADAASPDAFGADDIERVVASLRRSRDAYDFRLGRREVAGVDARCLVTELRPGREPTEELGAKGTLCVSAEGVPLLVETPAASLRALRYSTSVDDDTFDLPAEVTP